MSDSGSRRIWYAAYASNLAWARFRCYLRGGSVPGGGRSYPGCRDQQDPTGSVGLEIRGRLVFAGRSSVWGGAIAFHDPYDPGPVACRGYLVTREQLADVVAQETRQPPGGPVARRVERCLDGVDGVGGHVHTWDSPGLYDALVVHGRRDGVPVVTLTHGRAAALTPAAPTTAYLRWIVAGLREAHNWDADRVGRYLARMPGLGPGWTPEAIGALQVGTAGSPPPRP